MSGKNGRSRRILLTGAALSAVLFEAGKWAIELYL